MNTKTVTGFAMLAVAATPFAASAQSMAELIAKNPSLAAILAPYMAQSTSTASCAGTITKSLKKGMTDAEIVTLQSMLNASADTAVATSGTGSKGMESSYFGAATKAAVIKFQNKYASEVLTPNGLTVGTGSVGAATRAKLNAMCATAATGTTTTAGNTTTGSTSSTGLQGTAGSASVVKTTVDVDTDTYKVGSTKKALGFKVEATGSDIKVTNVRVEMDVNVANGTSASDRLTAYAKEVSIFANGAKVGSVAASAFNRDSAGIYTANIAVSDAVVRMNSSNKVTFHVAITALDAMDSDDITGGSVVVKLLNTRYVDASGVTLSETPTVSAPVNSASVSFGRVSSDSDVKFRLAESSNNPTAKNVEVSKSNSTNVVLATFKLKAEKADMSFDKVTVALTSVGSSTSDIASDIYLKKGDTTLETFTAVGTGNSETAIFNLATSETIKADDTQEYSIVARVNKVATGYTGGNSLTATIVNTSFNAQTVTDGKNIVAGNRVGTSVTTYAQSFFTKGITVALKSTNSTVSNNDTTASSSFGTFEMNFDVTAFGSDDVFIPLLASNAVSYDILNSAGTSTTSGSPTATLERVSGGSEKNNTVLINSGNTASFKLKITVDPTAADSYRAVLKTVGFRADDLGATAASSVNLAPAQDFRSAYSNTIKN